MKRLPALLQQHMLSRNVPAAHAARAAKRYSDELQIEILGDICRTNREFLEAAMGLFAVLENELGRRTLDAATANIVFHDGTVADRYNALLLKTQNAANEQTEIQQRVLANRKKKR